VPHNCTHKYTRGSCAHIFPKQIYETILRTLSLTFEPYQLRT